jgi:hypothetical protein
MTEAYLAQLTKVLIGGDPTDLIRLVYESGRGQAIRFPTDPAKALAILHKLRASMDHIPLPLRRQSQDWLIGKGMHPTIRGRK